MERDETIQEKEKRIYDLKKKNQELEKFKFVLDYKIKVKVAPSFLLFSASCGHKWRMFSNTVIKK